MLRNNDYTGSLLDYLYHQSYYKRVGIELLKQTNTSIPQQMNFVAKLEKKMMVQQCFLWLKSSKKPF